MSLSAKLRRAPGRIVTGAFILNSGIGKLGGNDDTAKALHAMASGAYPVLDKIPPKPLLKAVAASEIALGAGLLLPVVPAGLAGLALVGFSGSLLGMWWRTPGMHEEGSPRPTQQGMAIAKDVWMLGIGAGLVADAVLESGAQQAHRADHRREGGHGRDGRQGHHQREGSQEENAHLGDVLGEAG